MQKHQTTKLKKISHRENLFIFICLLHFDSMNLNKMTFGLTSIFAQRKKFKNVAEPLGYLKLF